MIGSAMKFGPIAEGNISTLVIVFGSIAAVHAAILGVWMLLRSLNERQSRRHERQQVDVNEGPWPGAPALREEP